MMFRKPLIGMALALCLLASGSLLQTGEAFAGEAGAGKSCRDNDPGGVAGHDACVLQRNGSTEGDYAAWLCKVLDDSGTLTLLGKSYAECVRTFAKA